MNKNAKFTGQPIFSQLLNLIDRKIISKNALKHNSNRYYKKFKTHQHLITMLYAIFHKCTSIREVVTGMQVCNYKLNHLGLDYAPRKSTLSDANSRRDSKVFEAIFKDLYNRYHKSLPDSQLKTKWFKSLFIVDSTTISLFKEILKNAGRNPINGKRKGGIKVHTMIKASEDVPCLVKLTAAAKHDAPFMKELNLTKGSIVVFDKAYIDYTQFDKWTKQNITWVTRLKKTGQYEIVRKNIISANQKKLGVISDQQVILGHTSHQQITRTAARLIEYYDKDKDRIFTFITNSEKYVPATIAKIYKHRWQIEILFKRLKQNYPIQYFLGDNENAIKIQIWCALIADLLLKVVLTQLKRKWSFANLSSMIRIHLMTYVKLFEFLNNPNKQLINYNRIRNKAPTLF